MRNHLNLLMKQRMSWNNAKLFLGGMDVSPN